MDKCPLCESYLSVMRSYPTTEIGTTQIWMVQELQCRNPRCENYGKVLETRKTEYEKFI